MNAILKVLVVDDSRLIHALYESLLPEIELVHAYDGADALTCLQQHADADLILLDLRMPNMDGLTFLHATRRTPEIAQIPTILVTSEYEHGDVAAALQRGARGYLAKPFRRAELLRTMESVLIAAHNPKSNAGCFSTCNAD